MQTFSKHSYKRYCNQLKSNHSSIVSLHERDGYPPYWKRENGFESLCKTIIEQQVSLASAKSSYKRLELFCGHINPSTIHQLTESEFKSVGITKQKARYLLLLSETLLQEPTFFQSLEKLDNHLAKEKLMALKGIGHWTANVYLLVALNRINLYPDFDVALINSISFEAFQGKKIDNEIAKQFVATFEPLQSIACCYYYHAYIVRKKITFDP